MKTHTIWRSGLLSAALCTVVLTALPWLQGCGLPYEPCSKPATDLYMTAEDSAAVPYRGGETLRYQRSINGVIKDTLVFESVSAKAVKEDGENCYFNGCHSEAVFHHPEWVYQTSSGLSMDLRLELDAYECSGGGPRSSSPELKTYIPFGEGYNVRIDLGNLTLDVASLVYNYYQNINIGGVDYDQVWSIKYPNDSYTTYYHKSMGIIAISEDEILIQSL